jgi:uncharacterized protein (TIGR02246 family)
MTDRAPSPETVSDLIDSWARCWNAHDMAAAVRLVAPDVEFVTVSGTWLRGAAEFLAHHEAIHRAQMRDSRWTNLAHAARPLRDGMLLVHLEWSIAGDRNPDDVLRPPRRGVFTWLVTQHERTCRILAAHNTDLRPGVFPRLRAAHPAQAPNRGDLP